MQDFCAQSHLTPREKRKFTVIPRDALQDLINALAAGHEDLGPTLRDSAIVYGTIHSLPISPPAGRTSRKSVGIG
jgi:hypothetical protein